MAIGCRDLDLAGTLPNYVNAIRAPSEAYQQIQSINAGTDKRSSELPPKAGSWKLAEVASRRSTCSLPAIARERPSRRHRHPCELQLLARPSSADVETAFGRRRRLQLRVVVRCS